MPWLAGHGSSGGMVSKRSRREFLTELGTITAAAMVTPSLMAQASRQSSIRLGGPLSGGPSDPGELARAHRAHGYRAAYAPNIPLTDSARIKAVSEAFAKNDVVLAEVGRWCNLMDQNPEKRRQNLENVTQGLALAEALGARCAVDIAGSHNAESWFGPHPDNLSPGFFDAAVENARKIIDEVKPKRAKFCYEMMGWAIPHTPDSALKLLKAVDRKGFGIHLDPCNLVNSPEKIYRNADLINECFDKLGKYIVSCHAKDLAWKVEMNVHFVEVVPGTGVVDYGTYLRRLARLPDSPPLMLEHLSTPEEYRRGAEYIMKVGKTESLSFG